jgi:hypothetical protein
MAGNHACFDYRSIECSDDLFHYIKANISQPEFTTGDRIYDVEDKKYGIIIIANKDDYLIDYDDGSRVFIKKSAILIKVR